MYNHWSRQPLREVDKPMWYTLEKHKPRAHEHIVFGRQSYIFGKARPAAIASRPFTPLRIRGFCRRHRPKPGPRGGSGGCSSRSGTTRLRRR